MCSRQQEWKRWKHECSRKGWWENCESFHSQAPAWRSASRIPELLLKDVCLSFPLLLSSAQRLSRCLNPMRQQIETNACQFIGAVVACEETTIGHISLQIMFYLIMATANETNTIVIRSGFKMWKRPSMRNKLDYWTTPPPNIFPLDVWWLRVTESSQAESWDLVPGLGQNRLSVWANTNTHALTDTKHTHTNTRTHTPFPLSGKLLSKEESQRRN